MEGRSQRALDVGLEHSGGGRSFHRQRRSHPFRVKARKERGVLAAVPRDLEEGSLPYGCVGIKGSERGVGAHLIDEPPIARHRCARPPCATGSSRTRLVLLPLWIFFSAPTQTAHRPAHRSFAHLHPRDGNQELSSLGVGSPRPFLEVLSEQLPGLLVEFRFLGGSLPGL